MVYDFRTHKTELHAAVVACLRNGGGIGRQLTGRFLHGTEELIHVGNEHPGEREIIQFCGDIPEEPLDELVLLAALHKIADAICACVGVTYARIRICGTNVEENHTYPRKPIEEVPAPTPQAPTDTAA